MEASAERADPGEQDLPHQLPAQVYSGSSLLLFNSFSFSSFPSFSLPPGGDWLTTSIVGLLLFFSYLYYQNIYLGQKKKQKQTQQQQEQQQQLQSGQKRSEGSEEEQESVATPVDASTDSDEEAVAASPISVSLNLPSAPLKPPLASAATTTPVKPGKANGSVPRSRKDTLSGSIDDSDSQHADDELEDSGTDAEQPTDLSNSKTGAPSNSSTAVKAAPKSNSNSKGDKGGGRAKRKKQNRGRIPSKSFAEAAGNLPPNNSNSIPIINVAFSKSNSKNIKSLEEHNVTPGAAADCSAPMLSSTEEDTVLKTNGRKDSSSQKEKKKVSKFFVQLDLSEQEIYDRLQRHLVDPGQLSSEGFLTAADTEPGKAFIIKAKKQFLRDPDQVGDTGGEISMNADPLASPKVRAGNKTKLANASSSLLNIKADEFYPMSYPSSPDAGRKQSPSLSVANPAENSIYHNNNGNGAKTAPCMQRVTSLNVMANEFVPQQQQHGIPTETNTKAATPNSLPRVRTAPVLSSPALIQTADGSERLCFERKCVRCPKSFYTFENGDYVQEERCHYHWGKKMKNDPDRAVNGNKRNSSSSQLRNFSCCVTGKNKHINKKGCMSSARHVWSGLTEGFNYVEGFVTASDEGRCGGKKKHLLLALDGEMGYTSAGLELIQLTVVGIDGLLLYESLVFPDRQILDFNTRFSGITSRDMHARTTRSLKDVQRDMLELMTSDTVLIGHGLENDLRALKLVHSKVLDTSLLFPKDNGRRQSLKSIVKDKLQMDIQTREQSGHDSFEDARACVDLVLWMLCAEKRKK